MSQLTVAEVALQLQKKLAARRDAARAWTKEVYKELRGDRSFNVDCVYAFMAGARWEQNRDKSRG